MRAILLLLVITFLCQSCFSYRTVDRHDRSLKLDKRYRIELEERTFRNAELKATNDSTMSIFVYNKNFEVNRSDINKIQRQKISVVKTIAYPLGTVAALVGLFIVSYSN